MTLLEALKYVRDAEKGPRMGICGMIEELFLIESEDYDTDMIIQLHELFKEWPDVHIVEYVWGTGPNSQYPVGGWVEYNSSKDLWSNPKRHALLNWCIAKLESEE